MRSARFLSLALLIFIFAFSTLSYAGVPQMINYQGKITTPAGALIDTTIGMIFTIYDDSTGGNILWTETQLSVVVQKGIFSVLLGSGNTITDSVFNGNVRYLGVKVGADAEMTPRKPMVSVAYAYRAGTADVGGTNSGWVDDGTVVRLDTNIDSVGIGTTSPNEQLEITRNLRLPVTTATAGIIKVGTDRFIHSYGEGNTFIGENAGNLTMTGSYNTANGFKALTSNSTGYNNTANGYWALYSNSTGYHNTANGYEALSSNTIGWANTANGYLALHNTTGIKNTANGAEALYSNNTGNDNTAIGYAALYSNSTGYDNTALGSYADVSSGNLTNATAIGRGTIVDASNKVRIGNSSVTVIEGQVDWSFTSDARLKTNVQESPLGLDFVLKLKPITYNFLAKGQEGITYTGLVAQDVEKVLDELGVEFSGLVKPANKDDSYGLRYATFVVPLIKALQEQQEQIKALQQRIEELENK